MITFKIDNISTSSENNQVVMEFKTHLMAKIEFCCDEHSNLFRLMKLHSEGRHADFLVSIKIAIQQLLDHEYYTDMEINMPRCNCSIKKDKLIYDFNGLQEPYKTLFESIFKSNDKVLMTKLINYG